MAKEFLRQLPRIARSDLPSDARCPICYQQYENLTTDSGSFEKPVALPCHDGHIFGQDCLLAWLEYRRSCPFCRREMVLPNDETIAEIDTKRACITFTIQRNQEWDDYWYGVFWILHLQGDLAIERKWQQWQHDWLAAGEEWSRSSHARALAALSLSTMTTRRILQDPYQIRITAAGIQTLRFREYRLFLRFQTDAGEHPQLKAPPGFQLTPSQEDALFLELERRQAFTSVNVPRAIGRRAQWNKLRDVGFVWDPDWEVSWHRGRGRWSRYAY